MDIKIAASRTAILVHKAKGIPDSHPEHGKDHLIEMVNKIIHGEVTGDKAHRWLGYIQGCVKSCWCWNIRGAKRNKCY